MKIAVVGPSPVPFTIGGAENLLTGLCESINKYTSHQAELIKLPVKEQSFWDLIDSYYLFYKLDLNHFDLVISTKYPSWMVYHKNSICYMVHTLRGLYDTYHLMGQPVKIKRGVPEIDTILNFIENKKEYSDLAQFFDLIFKLKNKQKIIPEEYFLFPGAFIRIIVHYLDNVALSQKGIKKICAISQTVKNRIEYYPKNVKISVVYPPTNLTKVKMGNYDYVFMISRLDAPKRIDMLIKAMQYVKSDVKLLIAGTGPQAENLKKLAEKDIRIKFLGFVSDELAEEYYANSLVIPYFPYDEDYGLITIEAMLHKKPVITTTDAGGPNEFVENGVTGFVTAFDAKKIGEKIDYFVCHPEEAKRMGENAYIKVKDITWKNVVSQLLNDITTPYTISKRKKITVTSTFPIYPPTGGGQARIYNLYKHLAKHYDVEIVSFTNSDQLPYEAEIAENLVEIRIPKTQKHQESEWKIEQKAGIPVSDIGMITLSGETEEYCKRLERSISTSEWVVISHPYLYEEAKKYLNGKKFIYEAHNVEAIMKETMLPQSSIKKELVKRVFQTEQDCCRESTFVMTCSEEDTETLAKMYGIPKDKMIVVPNGVDCEKTRFTSVEERIVNKKRYGLEHEKIGLFMGSWHKPNLDACEEIFKIAEQCPDVKFMLMGSQCAYFEKRKIPSNVGMLGLVSEEVKNRIFSVVDFALNPMMSGSGTNLKMFDYMASGIPIITTEFGTRGIERKELFIITDLNGFIPEINKLGEKSLGNSIQKAREYVKGDFNWSKLSERLYNKMIKNITCYHKIGMKKV